jgi:hypothetical protein
MNHYLQHSIQGPKRHPQNMLFLDVTKIGEEHHEIVPSNAFTLDRLLLYQTIRFVSIRGRELKRTNRMSGSVI